MSIASGERKEARGESDTRHVPVVDSKPTKLRKQWLVARFVVRSSTIAIDRTQASTELTRVGREVFGRLVVRDPAVRACCGLYIFVSVFLVLHRVGTVQTVEA